MILPQAVRRVIPPLLNDFIGLQKDTALVGTLGAIEAFQQSQIDANATFNFTAYLAAAVLFVAITIPLARFTDWLIAARPPPAAGGGRSQMTRRRSGSRVCTSRSASTRCCAASTSRSASTRSSA